MNTLTSTSLLIVFLACASAAAQSDGAGNGEGLKVAALEALVSAPPERALPIVTRVLQGDGSDDLKQRALFVLSQIDLPEAQVHLLDTARNGEGMLRQQAIRMIGVSGDPVSLEQLAAIYTNGDQQVKNAVMEAYLIADDSAALYQLAANAQSATDFDEAVRMLGAMGALEELGRLRESEGVSEVMIEALAIAGDTESLEELARAGNDPTVQAQAIRGLAIAGEESVGPLLMEIYRSADSPTIREVAREGLLIADFEEGVLALFRESSDGEEKQALLQTLVDMESDAVWDIIETTLDND